MTFLSLLIFSAMAPQKAWAFPEMVRDGYVNCISCHVSPTGGGTLTSYGRALSKDILSYAGEDFEAKALYGAVDFPKWILMGGDVRFLQLYSDTPTVRQATFFPMEADLEAAAIVGKFTVDATVGPQENPSVQYPTYGYLFSRRHYLDYKPTDTLSFRAGRFFPAFGINTPDHIIVTKRGLGWDEGGETYNVEFAYLGEDYNLYATADFGRPDVPQLNTETGGAFTASTSFLDRYKVGASYYHGTNNSGFRDLFGPWGILGFTSHFFMLAEFDGQNSVPAAGGQEPTAGMVDYVRVDYELVQGVHAFLTQQYSQLDFTNPLTIMRIYGAGLQIFPRPHFEFQFVWEKQQVLVSSQAYNDYAYILLHFYP